jgi:hypothetical protein
VVSMPIFICRTSAASRASSSLFCFATFIDLPPR